MKNKEFMKLVKTKVFNMKQTKVEDLKHFKALVRDVGVVPNYASEYKAISVYKYLSVDDLGEAKLLEPMDFLEAVFLLISVGMQVSEIFLFDKTAAGTPEEKDLKQKVKQYQTQHQEKANEHILKDEALSEKLTIKKAKFLVKWITQQAKIGAKTR